MRLRFVGLVVLCFVARAQTASIVEIVRASLGAGSPAYAQQALDRYRASRGVTPEYIEALSWMGRAELASKNYAAAERNAAEVRKLCLEQLAHRKIDAEPALPLALGASIEVEAEAAVAQGRRDEAVLFLRAEASRWPGSSLSPRIQKNLNLLTLEGKPAPALDVAHGLTDRKPLPLAAHRGHPVLLFFWAHWCSDCKNEIAIIAKLEQTYRNRGLVVVAPTRHYGYVAGGAEAPPAAETPYIRTVFDRYYAGLGPVEIPLSEANFLSYGVSTTPTLVIVDARGIVRLYHPGNLDFNQLAGRIAPLL
jgi:thiol-disulfide isomerase/thioredoxin